MDLPKFSWSLWLAMYIIESAWCPRCAQSLITYVYSWCAHCARDNVCMDMHVHVHAAFACNRELQRLYNFLARNLSWARNCTQACLSRPTLHRLATERPCWLRENRAQRGKLRPRRENGVGSSAYYHWIPIELWWKRGEYKPWHTVM